ncbi:Iqg1p ASCRUDRAFT_77301 [Ascoidea rubescens DSM 1968]|uniref:Calponin-homology (CH) domain-containing protein n=1 Tax=Ascoidea rubescens DSM 1968 TaxID=1344418 RepID=A0A1D2VC03_9ASCO|nr:hypothetical protein ASCRUDRAFT_77301 [Ascoidea rubescens DSM 1968]ODV59218.1 hypothetical protein ASCRUDRAFT_77301 [Ascoidea rubescens DSM 1968]
MSSRPPSLSPTKRNKFASNYLDCINNENQENTFENHSPKSINPKSINPNGSLSNSPLKQQNRPPLKTISNSDISFSIINSRKKEKRQSILDNNIEALTNMLFSDDSKTPNTSSINILSDSNPSKINSSPLKSPLKSSLKSPLKSSLKPSLKSSLRIQINPTQSPTKFNHLQKSNQQIKKSKPTNSKNSKLAALDSNVEVIDLDNVDEVVGLKGRKRLQRQNSKDSRSLLSTSWVDNSRESLQGYEYLCRIAEAKIWIEQCTGESLPSEYEIAKDALRDGVILAKLTKIFAPQLVPKIIPKSKFNRLLYRHTENINYFFDFLSVINMPDLFSFELTDLYEAKNIPKVIFCIHALSFLLKDKAPKMQNLVGKLNFTDEEIKNSQKILDDLNMPNFQSVKEGGDKINNLKLKSSESIHDFHKIKEENTSPEISETLEIPEILKIPEISKIPEIIPTDSIKEKQSTVKIEPEIEIENALINVKLEPEIESKEIIPFEIKIPHETPKKLIKKEDKFDEEFEIRANETYNEYYNETTYLLQLNEPTENELESYIRSIVKTQAVCRGSIVRYQLFLQKLMLNSFSKEIISLQSAIRRIIFKKSNNYSQIVLKSDSYQNNITILQSIIRKNLLKKKNHSIFLGLNKSEKSVLLLQSLIRGNLSRKIYNSKEFVLANTTQTTISIQSFARSFLIRKCINTQKSALASEIASINFLNAIFKGKKTRAEINSKLYALNKASKEIIYLQSCIRSKSSQKRYYESKITFDSEFLTKMTISAQSIIRRILLQDHLNINKREILKEKKTIIELQSKIRANKLRKNIRKIKFSLFKAIPEITELQTIGRGGFVRNNLAYLLDHLDASENLYNNFAANVRGYLVRRNIKYIKIQMFKTRRSTVLVQSAFRGVFSRFQFELIFDQLYENEIGIVAAQASIRGYLVRKRYRDMMNYYNQHINEIMKIQSYIKGRCQGNAYRLLTSMKNPPLAVVRKFAHLLNDTNSDFEEEVKLEKLKEEIKKKSRENERIEMSNEKLDSKIALLLKNKITLDEILHHGNNLKGKSLNSGSITSKTFGGSISSRNSLSLDKSTLKVDVSSLNKAAKQRIEAYQSLFYILQTQPCYLSRLFSFFEIEQKSKMKTTESYIPKIFQFDKENKTKEFDQQSGDTNDNSREEFLFVKLISDLIDSEFSHINDVIEFFQSENKTWQRLLMNYNNTIRQKTLLKTFFGPLISKISKVNGLSLESDPLIIYRDCVRKEKETGNCDDPLNISVEDAIQEPKTRSQFVKNLKNLREITGNILSIIDVNIDRFPKHIKALCYNTYQIISKRFPLLNEKDKVSAVGFIMIDNYINQIIQNPEKFEVELVTFSSNELLKLKNNLNEVIRVMTQLIFMEPFSDDDVFLHPLNDFIISSSEKVFRIFKKIINIEDVETLYGVTVYDDFTSHLRPTLEIDVDEVISMQTFLDINLDILAPSKDDPIRTHIENISKLSLSSKDLKKLITSRTFKLNLNPSTRNWSNNEVKTNTLFVQVKRCIIYLMIVQNNVSDLMNLLLSKIEPKYEIKFKELIQEEIKDHGNSNSYSTLSQSSLGQDLTTMTYHSLKCMTLEKVLELEEMKEITRKDKFQRLLNVIAIDIKTKHGQRLKRQKEIVIAERTLKGLYEKEKYLKNLSQTFAAYIEKAMSTLQKKPSFNKRIIPFTKNFFFQRELRKQGRITKFGSYKISSKRLFEEGILKSIKNDIKLTFIISCDKVGIFNIEALSNLLPLSSPVAEITLDELLQHQYENEENISMFDGVVLFDTNMFLTFIFKKFYDNNHKHRTLFL